MLTTIGTEYRRGMPNSLRNRRMSKPSIGQDASPLDVAASNSSYRAVACLHQMREGARVCVCSCD